MSREAEDTLTHVLMMCAPHLVTADRTKVGEGLENVAYLVAEELIVRLVKNEANKADAVSRDLVVFDISSRISDLPVPTVLLANKETGVIAYRALPGTPLIDCVNSLQPKEVKRIAQELGRFLGTLHTAPIEQLRGIVQEDIDGAESWLDETRELASSVWSKIPNQHRGSLGLFLNSEVPASRYKPVFSHNDLGIEHVLVDTEQAELRVSGIID